MDKAELRALLQAVKTGEMDPDDALVHLKLEPFEDIGYAKIDHHRGIRQGAAEVIYGAGKTPEQICGIVERMLAGGGGNILITRMEPVVAEQLGRMAALEYDAISMVGIVNRDQDKPAMGSIVIVSGGTSDMAVCEEAALTAEVLGNRVTRLYDVGVAGLHRLLANLEVLVRARVVVAVAGMEGALASVVGGLVDCPVVAVPTSVGYGANFGGLSALLSMLNSCASGVSVVNIDNGFGAGYLASMINQMESVQE